MCVCPTRISPMCVRPTHIMVWLPTSRCTFHAHIWPTHIRLAHLICICPGVLLACTVARTQFNEALQTLYDWEHTYGTTGFAQFLLATMAQLNECGLLPFWMKPVEVRGETAQEEPQTRSDLESAITRCKAAAAIVKTEEADKLSLKEATHTAEEEALSALKVCTLCCPRQIATLSTLCFVQAHHHRWHNLRRSRLIWSTQWLLCNATKWHFSWQRLKQPCSTLSLRRRRRVWMIMLPRGDLATTRNTKPPNSRALSRKAVAGVRLLSHRMRVPGVCLGRPIHIHPTHIRPTHIRPTRCAFARCAFARCAFARRTFARRAFARRTFARRDARSPDAHSPDARSPDAHSPDALSPDAHSLNARSPDAHSPDAQRTYLLAGVNQFVAGSVALAALSKVWIYGQVPDLSESVTEPWRFVVTRFLKNGQPIKGMFPEKHLSMEEIPEDEDEDDDDEDDDDVSRPGYDSEWKTPQYQGCVKAGRGEAAESSRCAFTCLCLTRIRPTRIRPTTPDERLPDARSPDPLADALLRFICLQESTRVCRNQLLCLEVTRSGFMVPSRAYLPPSQKPGAMWSPRIKAGADLSGGRTQRSIWTCRIILLRCLMLRRRRKVHMDLPMSM